MKKMGRVSSLVLAGCMAAGLVGCGGGGSVATTAADAKTEMAATTGAPTESTQSPAAAAQPSTDEKVVTVMTITPPDDKYWKMLEDQKALFEKMNPGYVLEFTTGTMSMEDGTLVTMLNSGVNLPDVINFSTGPSRVGPLAASGNIRALDDLYEKYGWTEKLTPAALDLTTHIDGKLYEVPDTIDSIACYYNTEIFKELGLEVPTTWEEFLNICEKTKEAGYDPIALGAREGYSSGWFFGNLLQSTGGTEASRKLIAGETKWTEAPASTTLATLADFVGKGYISETSLTYNQSDALYSFLNGKAAMHFIGSWVISSIYDSGMEDKISSFPLPSQVGDPAYVTSGIGKSFAIPSGITDTTGAELWMNFTMTPEYAELMGQQDAGSICTSKAFSEVKVKTELLQTSKDMIAEGAGRNPSAFIPTDTKNAYFQNIQGILAGIVTAEEAGQNIQDGQDKDLQAGMY